MPSTQEEPEKFTAQNAPVQVQQCAKTVSGRSGLSDDVFGEAFYRIRTNRELFVLAKTDCEVLFFSYSMQELCDKNCAFHHTLGISC